MEWSDEIVIVEEICEVYLRFMLCVYVCLYHVLFNIVYMLFNESMLYGCMWLKYIFPVLFKGFCYLSGVRSFIVLYEEVLQVLCCFAFQLRYSCPELGRSVYSMCLSVLYDVVPVCTVVFLSASKNVSPEDAEVPQNTRWR